MANTFKDNVAVAKFAKRCELAYQQKKTKLVQHTTVEQVSGLSTYTMPRIDSQNEAIVGKEYGADVVVQTMTWGKAQVDIKLIYATAFIDDLQKFETDIPLTNKIIETVTAAVRRGEDAEVIRAAKVADATASLEVDLDNGTLDRPGLTKFATAFDLANVDEENRVLVTSPNGIGQLMGDSTLIGNYHFPNATLSNGRLTSAMGFNLVWHTALPNGAGGSGERRSYAWGKGAMLTVVSRPFYVNVDWDSRKQGYQIFAATYMGRTIYQPQGVFWADVDNEPSL